MNLKNNYSKMTKAQLIKLIKKLQREKNEKNKVPVSERKHFKENILKLKKQEKELVHEKNQIEQSRDSYADFYDFAPMGCIILDEKGKIKNINLSAAEFIGTKRKSALNKLFIHFLVLKDVEKFNNLLHICRQSYDQSSGEFQIKIGKKENLDIYLTAIPFHDYKINKILFRIFFTDITERKKKEKIIEESEKRFRLMADASPVMIWMTDLNNRLEYMNKTKLDFLGIKPDKLTHELWLQTRHPEDRDNFRKKLLESSKQKKGFSLEVRVKDKEGNYRWLLDSAAPRFLEDGTFVGFVGSGVDITESKMSRIKMKKSLEEKELLMREVHHRVKNNLQVILSLLNLQASYIKDEESLSMFKSSQDRVQSMAMLHEKLYKSNNLAEINLKDYIKDLVSTLFKTYNISSGISLHLKIKNIILDLGISISLGLIINELITNALKHAFKGREKGKIFVEIYKIEEKGQLILIVKDDGVGIPEVNGFTEKKSFGLELVNTLITQYNGSLEIIGNGKTEIKICLEYNDENYKP